jgi:hypothetical protein
VLGTSSEGCSIKVLLAQLHYIRHGTQQVHDMWVLACGGDRDASTACNIPRATHGPPRTGTGNYLCRIPRHFMLLHTPICGRYDTTEVSSSIGISIGHVVVGTDIDQRETKRSRVAVAARGHNPITSPYMYMYCMHKGRVQATRQVLVRR